MPERPEFSVVAPFYNEASCARTVAEGFARAFAAAGLDFELVLVDNGSRDGTAAQLRSVAAATDSRARVVTVPENVGYGHGVIEGMRASRGRYVAVVPGDGQLAAVDAARVMVLVHERRPVFCKGVRQARGRSRLRRLVTMLYNVFFHVLFRSATHDVGAPPKVIERAWLERLAPTSRDWFLDVELVLKAEEAGLPIDEVRLDVLPRAGGRSHVGPAALWECLSNMVVYRATRGRAWKEKPWVWV